MIYPSNLRSLRLAAPLTVLATAAAIPAQTISVGSFGTVPSSIIARMDAQSPTNAVAADFAGNAFVWDGSTWTTVALGFAGNTTVVLADSTIDGQYILANTSGQVATVTNGTVTALPSLPNAVQTLAGNPQTGLFAGTTTGCFTLTGGAWTPVGATPVTGAVLDVEVTANGLVAVGSITVPGFGFTSAATFDGARWRPIAGAPAFEGEEVHVMSNGDFVMSSRIPGSPLRTISRLDATSGTWTRLTSNVDDQVEDIEELPNGDIAICGSFAQVDGFPRLNMARFDGSRWQAINTSISAGASLRSLVFVGPALLAVAGSFTSMDGFGESGVTGFGPTTAALSLPFAASCGIDLTTNALPFIGATTVATSSNLQPGLLLHLIGLSNIAPVALGPLLGANSNCFVEVDAGIVESFVVTSPSFAVSIAIPQNPALVGQPLFQQTVNWTNNNDAFSSEPLLLVIGDF